MRKEHASEISRNKLLTLAIAATLVVSALTIGGMPSASAASKTINAGTGQGSLYYEAKRIPGPHWDPCFATSCDQGTGPGTWVWFVLFNDAGEPIVADLANEDGVLITGLEVGKTYYLQPTDCVYPNCGEPPHDVIFNNWHDCSDTRQRPFVIAADRIESGAAYYRYYLHGEVNEPVACHTTGSPSPPAGGSTDGGSTGGGSTDGSSGSTGSSTEDGSTGGTTGGSNTGGNTGGSNNQQQPNNSGSGTIDVLAYLKFVERARNLFTAETGIATVGGSAIDIPDTNLSGKPIGSDSSLTYAEYDSLYDVVSKDPNGSMLVIRALSDIGVDWNHLSDMQKAYAILKMRTPGSSQAETIVASELVLNVPEGFNRKNYEDLVQKARELFNISETTTAADGKVSFDIPDANLSGRSIGSDPSLTYMPYGRGIEVIERDPQGAALVRHVLENFGINWHQLTNMQQAYAILKLRVG